METNRFDAVARLFTARKLSRRRALIEGAAAQARPNASGAAIVPAGEGSFEKIEFLFVQSFQSGSITPKESTDGIYTLKMEQGLGQTIYFANRPRPIVGATPTDRFLAGLGFVVANPPNAALVIADPGGTTDVAVLELFNPVFDPTSPGVTYDVQVLAEWQKELDVGFHEAPGDLAELPATFGPASLFIDDCLFRDIECYDRASCRLVGKAAEKAPLCWNYSLCQPCELYGHTYPDYCAGATYWHDRCNAAFGHLRDRNMGGCFVNWGWTMPFC